MLPSFFVFHGLGPLAMSRGIFRCKVSGLNERVQLITGGAFSLQPPRSPPSFLIMDFEGGLDGRSTTIVDRGLQAFG